MTNPIELIFSIAGIRVRVHSLDPVVYPEALEVFRTDGTSSHLSFGFANVPRLRPARSKVIYEGASHWRVREDNGALVYEMFYPPTAEVYCHMTGNAERSLFSVVFGRENLGTLPGGNGLDATLWFPYPFDQLGVIPILARRDAFLVHACGAVIDGKAFVFAGHSGDGKTTLSRLLASEGLELLSDERIAICCERGRFIAYGTPWHGEGDVVSRASYPLGGAFILRKSSEHRIKVGAPGALAAEFLARSIVPYYLAEETALILSLVQRMSEAVPLQELEFSLEPDLGAVLAHFSHSA